jgi:hypothetical protein
MVTIRSGLWSAAFKLSSSFEETFVERAASERASGGCVGVGGVADRGELGIVDEARGQ